MFNLEVWQEYGVFHLLDAPLGTPTQPAETPRTQLSPRPTEELPQYNPSAQSKRQEPCQKQPGKILGEHQSANIPEGAAGESQGPTRSRGDTGTPRENTQLCHRRGLLWQNRRNYLGLN